MYDIKRTEEPKRLEEALELLEDNSEAVLVAGGTDIMIHMKERKLKEATLISLMSVEELAGIRKETDGCISIGSGTCFSDIVDDTVVNEYFPFLAEACRQIGSPQIRNVATIGGNICNGVVSADSVPSLLVLDAELEITSRSGIEIIPIRDFHVGPGKTVLKQGDILTAIRIPEKNYKDIGGYYIKAGQRRAMEISTLGCAVAIRLKEDKKHVDEFRIAFGVAGPTPLRCPKLESSLSGEAVSDKLYRKIRNEVLSELMPRDSWRASLEYREQLIRTLSERATRQAVKRAGGNADV